MKKTIKTTLTLAGLALAATSLHAASVQVDINSTNTGSGPNQTGWSPWLFNQNFSGGLNVSSSFTYADATDGTLAATVATTTPAGGRSYGITNVDQSGGALSIPDVWDDLVFFNNNVNGSMTITLGDLSAGTYQFTSYSYANGPVGNPGFGDSGIADVSVNTGGGFVDTGLNVTMGANANPDLTTADLETNSTVTFQFTVANDNDQVSILYNGLAANGGDTFGINGFELTAVPEPSTTALLGLGGLALFLRRRK